VSSRPPKGKPIVVDERQQRIDAITHELLEHLPEQTTGSLGEVVALARLIDIARNGWHSLPTPVFGVLVQTLSLNHRIDELRRVIYRAEVDE
jgi:hypothetical protein